MKEKKLYVILVMAIVFLMSKGAFTVSNPLKSSKTPLYTGQGMTVTFKPSKLDKSKLKKAKWSVKGDTGVIKITTKSTKGKTKIAVKGKKPGTAYVCLKYGKKTYKLKVVVKNPSEKKTTEKKTTEKKPEEKKTTEKPATEEQKPEQTSALTVTTSVSTADLRYGDTVQVTANQPVYVAAASRDYFSDFPVVTVSDDGVITAKYVGSTEVLVTTSRIKANDWTVNGDTRWTGSDCQYVKVTVGYDKLQPQFTDYELKPAIDPAVRPISTASRNLFYVSNHTNMRELFIPNGYGSDVYMSGYGTYSKDSVSYGIVRAEFLNAGKQKIDIYEKNPTPNTRQAYTGYYLDAQVYANTVEVDVIDGWETLVTEIMNAYPARDETLFDNARTYIWQNNKSKWGKAWYYQVNTVYGAGLERSSYAFAYEFEGTCLGESQYMAALMKKIAAKVPQLNDYSFNVVSADNGNIGHVECVMYKGGQKIKTYPTQDSGEDYMIADFDPSREYVLKWTIYGDRTTAEALAAEQAYEYTEYGK